MVLLLAVCLMVLYSCAAPWWCYPIAVVAWLYDGWSRARGVREMVLSACQYVDTVVTNGLQSVRDK